MALSGALALAAIGCAGEFTPGKPGGGGGGGGGADAGPSASPDGGTVSTAQALFEANVSPVIVAACSPAGGCHSTQDPAFVSASLADAYSKVMGQRDRLFPAFDPSTARIIINGSGGHHGALYKPGDVDAIKAWLASEKAAAAGSSAGPSPLAIWSGCMNIDDWNAQDVANQWSNKNADGAGRCETCHNLGAEGFMASDQSQRVFDTITTDPSMMPSYFTLDPTATVVIINSQRLLSVGTSLAPHQEHGTFSIDGDPAMAALQAFYDLTLQRMTAGTCDPPKFPQ